MTVTSSPVYAQTPRCSLTRIVNADGVSPTKALFTAGSNGSILSGITCYVDGGTSYPAWLTIGPGPSGAEIVQGKVSALEKSTAIDLFSFFKGLPLDSNGNPFMFLEAGQSLSLKIPSTQVASGEVVQATAYGADF